MSPKIIKSLLLAAALGFFMLWVFEIFRTDLGRSYWLLMFSLTFLLAHQYYRLRNQPRAASGSAEARPPKKKPRPTKRKKKK